MRTLSRAEVREIDRRAIEEFGMPSLVLMENAGRGAAQTLLSLGVFGPVLICCGKGNNGGDGLVIARHLDNAGVSCSTVVFARPEELSPDAAANLRIVQKAGLDVVFDEAGWAEKVVRCEWIVDALFGTGLRGPVKAPFVRAIAEINASSKRVFAIDIPSGLDCDSGEPIGQCVRAEHTATFVAMKKGFANPASSAWTGRVHVIDIGVPRVLRDAR